MADKGTGNKPTKNTSIFGSRRRLADLEEHLTQKKTELERVRYELKECAQKLDEKRLEAEQLSSRLVTATSERDDARREAEDQKTYADSVSSRLIAAISERDDARREADRQRALADEVLASAEQARAHSNQLLSDAERQGEEIIRRARDEAESRLRTAREDVEEARRLSRESRFEASAIVQAARTEAADLIANGQLEVDDFRKKIRDEIREESMRLEELESRIVATEDLALLQEAGIYEYKHPLADAVAYKVQLEQLREGIKTLIRRDSAILATKNWSLDGSSKNGRRMVQDFSKLMLRAYNAEADNCVRSMKPYRLSSAVERLEKARDTIARLGQMMSIQIDPGYHSARVHELEMTADYMAKVEEEKERQRAEREQRRDEERAQKEFEREKERLLKERTQWARAHSKWNAIGDVAKSSEAQEKLDTIDAAIAGVEAREANIRTGWVYVISNIGAFGEEIVKVGLTRRLDPYERVRELGDASVPFRFDVHAIVFSEDAVSLENRLHQELNTRRVNRVNRRREFFHATPAEVLRALESTEAHENLLEFTEFAEAAEWRASVADIAAVGATSQ